MTRANSKPLRTKLTPEIKGEFKPVRVVALGGGTGLSMLLRGLKQHVALRKQDQQRRPISALTAVVTVTDDGGSSGRLRRDLRMLPPGDIRNCMVALSKDEALLGQLFQYRFAEGRGLAGHSFGNLFLTALTHVTGDFNEAIRQAGQVLAIRGRIFPSTTQNVTLEAVLEDGSVVAGESLISRSQQRIRRVRLDPRNVKPLPEALEAIRAADVVMLGPGSLYTSVIPNLLVHGIVDALKRSRAVRVYISNLMTQPGETGGYSVSDHIRAIDSHTRARVVDWVVVNKAPITPRLRRRYETEGSEPVSYDLKELQKLGVKVIFDDLVEEDGVVRHHAPRLTRLLLEEFIHRRR